jgi:dethiobiotin synthetase/adenosylmethionine--8-amino-7-oxononanoate aminotransferase
MFAGAIHEPALKIASILLELENGNGNGNGNRRRLSRVFFSDNGSTGMEVAVKMALRAAHVRYHHHWSDGDKKKIVILGLRGAYHGDTMGAMDCAEPNVYNEKVEWYDDGKGVWLSYPQILCVNGEWRVQVPCDIPVGPDDGQKRKFAHLSDVFDLEGRRARGEHKPYEKYILAVIRRHLDEGRRFGALILEPVVLGAGGMVLV